MHALLDAGVDELVEDDGVVPVWQRREQREVGEKAGGEIKRPLGAEKAGRERFQFGVLAVMPAQQPRARRSRRCVGVEGVHHSLA